MGCFGFVCKGCGTPINGDSTIGGEKCIMIHVRHGKEIGRIEGHYDEYGRVIEQENLPANERYRGFHEGLNGHSEICNSESCLDDSYFRINEKRVYQGREIDYQHYSFLMIQTIREAIPDLNEAEAEFLKQEADYEKQFAALPKAKRETYSGTAAWHNLCYSRAPEQEKLDLTPSMDDPRQSWGRIRKKYI